MTVRNITPTLANVLELLELEQPQLVSSEDLARYAREADVGWSTQLLVRRLRERGWLLDTGVRGVWEFVPAARAGAYGSGDRFSQIRAALHRDPGLPLAIASESAAFLLGYSSRVPAKEVVAVPRDVSVPPALRKGRVIRWDGPCKTAEVYGLPVWTVDTLLVAMSSRPSAYHDWPNVGEWLSVAARDANQDE